MQEEHYEHLRSETCADYCEKLEELQGDYEQLEERYETLLAAVRKFLPVAELKGVLELI